MKISILICTIPEPYRDAFYIDRLTDVLKPQYDRNRNDVEIVIESDEMQMTVGAKRNKLLNKAKGERIIFVDDDDLVSDNYVEKLLEYSKLDFDCVGIGVEFTKDGQNKSIYDYSFKKNINTRERNKNSKRFGQRVYGRMPNHLCLWKKDIALRCQFPDRNLGEDHEWAEQQLLKGYSLHLTEEIIYYYDFRSQNTQTRIRR
jgi:glycosyltransferase involved in cell wall biosynthesis